MVTDYGCKNSFYLLSFPFQVCDKAGNIKNIFNFYSTIFLGSWNFLLLFVIIYFENEVINNSYYAGKNSEKRKLSRGTFPDEKLDNKFQSLNKNVIFYYTFHFMDNLNAILGRVPRFRTSTLFMASPRRTLGRHFLGSSQEKRNFYCNKREPFKMLTAESHVLPNGNGIYMEKILRHRDRLYL